MRLAVGLLTWLCVFALPQAFALEPQSPSSPSVGSSGQSPVAPDPSAAPQPASSSPGAPVAALPAAQATSAAANSTLSPSAAPTTSSTIAENVKKPEKAPPSPQERALLAAGYKIKTRNGEKVFCRVQPVLGSRLDTQTICGTADQISLDAQRLQNDARSGQISGNMPGH
jgi:hypothetical protein